MAKKVFPASVAMLALAVGATYNATLDMCDTLACRDVSKDKCASVHGANEQTCKWDNELGCHVPTTADDVPCPIQHVVTAQSRDVPSSMSYSPHLISDPNSSDKNHAIHIPLFHSGTPKLSLYPAPAPVDP